MKLKRNVRIRRSKTAGFTLIEVLVVLAILTVAVGYMARTVGSVGRLGPVSRETGRAVDAARATVELLRSGDFEQVFADYNADPADDPGGAGSSLGANFPAFGLSPQAGDLDGTVGQVRFPVIGAELREDVVDANLGMPRDLNGDGAIDALDHSADYQVLPFSILLEWNGRTGDRSTEIFSTVVKP